MKGYHTILTESLNELSRLKINLRTKFFFCNLCRIFVRLEKNDLLKLYKS